MSCGLGDWSGSPATQVPSSAAPRASSSDSSEKSPSSTVTVSGGVARSTKRSTARMLQPTSSTNSSIWAARSTWATVGVTTITGLAPFALLGRPVSALR
jgi:hypothetical protein